MLKVPTIYVLNPGGKARAVIQFVTMEAAQSRLDEMNAGKMRGCYEIRMTPQSPERAAYTRRGVWRKSGIRQDNR